MKASNPIMEYPGKIYVPFQRLYVPDFLGRASLPHRDPESSTYVAKDRKYLFYISTGHEFSFRKNGLIETGIPYGIFPRLMLTLISTYAVYNKEREIILSDSFSKFITKMGYDVAGGERGSITNFKKQLRKLLNCRMCIVNLDPQNKQVIRSKDYLNHIDRIEIWDSSNHDKQHIKPVKAILSESFYKQIIKYSFPVDPKTIEALRPSLLALDLYYYFCNRTKRLNGKDAYISWSDLEKQIGSNYKQTNEFTRNSKKAIELIQRFYPELIVGYQRGRLILKRDSKPHIKEKVINKKV